MNKYIASREILSEFINSKVLQSITISPNGRYVVISVDGDTFLIPIDLYKECFGKNKIGRQLETTV